jgi:hypothetical protein
MILLVSILTLVNLSACVSIYNKNQDKECDNVLKICLKISTTVLCIKTGTCLCSFIQISESQQISCIFAFFTLWKRVKTHFQRTTCSQIYFCFSSYLLRKPHLFVILTAIGWFIISIQSDLFWHRCLERQAFGTPQMYTLSPLKTNKNACIIRSECTHYAYILLCKQTFQIRSVLVVVYKAIHFCLWEIPPIFTAVLIMSSMIPLTILSLDTNETVGNLSIEFFVALLRLVSRVGPTISKYISDRMSDKT